MIVNIGWCGHPFVQTLGAKHVFFTFWLASFVIISQHSEMGDTYAVSQAVLSPNCLCN